MTTPEPVCKPKKQHKKRHLRRCRTGWIYSLRLRVVAVLIVSTLVGMSLAFGILQGGEALLDATYMQPDACAARQTQLLQDFRAFVAEKKIASRDITALKNWCRSKKNVYLTIYRTDSSVFGTDGSSNALNVVDESTKDRADESSQAAQTAPTSQSTGAQTGQQASQESSQSSANSDTAKDAANATGTDNAANSAKQSDSSDFVVSDSTVYPVNFTDGKYAVALTDFSESVLYDLIYYGALGVFFLTLLIGMLIYINRITNRVAKISWQAARIDRGDPDVSLRLKGSDEIASLAGNLEHMKQTLLDRLDGEQKAYRANTDLITSISHDLRNPLTSLLGYLGILCSDPEPDEATRKKYLTVCRDKATQLKDLTDELFGYFLVFGKAHPAVHPEIFPARLLLEQLLGEQIAALENEGFAVYTERVERAEKSPGSDTNEQADGQAVLPEPQLMVDAQLLARLADNLFSNLRKYADPQKPIQLVVETTASLITVTLENAVKPGTDRVESTKIGLKTCEKIAGSMGGSFSGQTTGTKKEWFTATFSLPVISFPKATKKGKSSGASSHAPAELPEPPEP